MKWMVYCLMVFSLGCKEKSKLVSDDTSIISEQSQAEGLHVVDFEGLKPHLFRQDDKLHVVNFWATWCAPCVKELPYFEALKDNYKDQNIEVLLVSLDFPDKYQTKLIPFLEKYQLRSEVIALDDTDQNKWIPAINEDWSGAIPATLIYKGDKRKFYEQSFTEEELKSEIEQFLN